MGLVISGRRASWPGLRRLSGALGALACASCLAAGALGCAGQVDFGGVEVGTAGAPGALRAEAVARRAARAVAVIETDTGRAMGFVVDPSGYMVTNRHVIEQSAHIERVHFVAHDPPLEFRRVEVVYADPRQDLALLRIALPPGRTLPALPVAVHATGDGEGGPRIDDRVLVLARDPRQAGDPEVTGARGEARTPGLLARTSSISETGVQNPAVGEGGFLGITSTVERGQSGGPVVDRQGRVVGVVTWTWRDRPGGFAVPAAEVARMLAERPELDSTDAHRARIEARAGDFLSAMGAEDLDRARALTAPTHARRVHEDTLERVFGRLGGPGAAEVIDGYLDALDGALVGAGTDPDELFAALGTLAAEVSSEAGLDALGLRGSVPPDRVSAFFLELGRAYLAARLFADRDRQDALALALERLQSLDTARSFALASSIDTLTRPGIAIEEVHLSPGAYAPQAVVSLLVPQRLMVGRRVGTQDQAVPGDRLMLQMRHEWGDWYVADLQIVSGGSGSERASSGPLARVDAAAIMDGPAPVRARRQAP